jgi:peptide/nickel transport system permease protein
MSEDRNTLTEAVPEKKRHFLLLDLVIRLVKEKPLGTVGAVIVLVMFIVGISADLIAPYGFNDIHLKDSLTGPSAQYILGTDNLGRDMLSRIIYGARISMVVGLAGAALRVGVSALIGGISGFLGGKVDLVIQRFVDAFMCFPPLVVVLTVMAILKPGLGTVIMVLGIQGGIMGSRVIRSAVIAIKENVYLEAAKAIGCPTWRILLRHILPNIMPVMIISFTVSMGAMILMEASLSFLGFGIPPPEPSWGGMLSGSGRQYMLLAPWMALWPGAALSIVVFGINMMGDAVRDILDPRLRGGLGRYGGTKKKEIAKASAKSE